MTRDDIIRMAREAGMLAVSFNRTSGETELSAYTPELERFAALVAAAVEDKYVKHAADLIVAAVEAEREACAELAMQGAKDNPVMGASACYWVAAAIRARGKA